MGFTKKHGATGWPNPQARQIEGWCGRNQIEVDRHEALTGTVYLTLESPAGETITVRVADHADAHCTATYTVDPAIDQRPAIKRWIAANGDDTAAKAVGAAKREFRALLKLAGPNALMVDGSRWYSWSIAQADTTAITRAKHQIKHGYAADNLSEGWKGID